MGILLSLSRIYVPDFIKKHQLENLFRDTAVAFQAQSPSLKYLDYKKCLEKYAIFTSKEK
jgi:hypothetical protein